MPQASSSIDIQPINAALGAEIKDIDLKDIDDALFAEIRQAWLDNLVVVIRGQNINDDEQIRFSRFFGELDEVPPVSVGQKARENKYVSVVTNIKENGVPIGSLGDEEVFWHSDTCYREKPPSAGILYCHKVPDWGGNTGFSNQYLALETLDPRMRARIDDLFVKSDITYTPGGQLRAGYEPTDDIRKSPGAIHPIIRTHPETGRNALYLGRRRNAYIIGLELEESESLLDDLWAHATQDSLCWHHEWQVGDIVIWDNRCVMHRRDNFDPDTHRVMHRTQVQDPLRPYYYKSEVKTSHPCGQ